MMTRHPSAGQNHKAPYFWIHVDILKVNPSRNKQPSLLGPSPWALCALQVPFAVQASGPLLWFQLWCLLYTCDPALCGGTGAHRGVS